ncbi:hypothetical protein EAI_01772 [Harpegnathos saltator]|uniref:Myb/SANT-like DNA-binding domain-containing protein n=1 Tax=Harpegnathos saltator TaxID=610380 RepID=E2BBS3_HARSA|nr:hypothetical protein EAI_01772 [Harpegnathos saltator]
MVAAELNETGYNVNDSQCKSKMAGLRNTYKSIKDYNGKHNYSNRRWRYFNIMDEMYKKRPWTSPTLTNNSVSEHNVDEEKTDVSPSKTELPSKRLKQIEKVIAVVEESSTERRRMHQEAMTRQDKLLDMLEKLHNK